MGPSKSASHLRGRLARHQIKKAQGGTLSLFILIPATHGTTAARYARDHRDPPVHEPKMKNPGARPGLFHLNPGNHRLSRAVARPHAGGPAIREHRKAW